MNGKEGMYYNYIILKAEYKTLKDEVNKYETMIEIERNKSLVKSSQFDIERVDSSPSNDKMDNITSRIIALEEEQKKYLVRFDIVNERMEDIIKDLKKDTNIIDRIFYYKYVMEVKKKNIPNYIPFSRANYYNYHKKLETMIHKQKLDYDEINF